MDIEFYNTPSVEGRKILSYQGLVHASQVAGTGFLTDFVASFSDFFGGNSGVYRSTMDELCQNVLQQLEESAREKGANAVVGLHIDFDNISAKGMSMFMVSAQGTAVSLEEKSKNISSTSKNNIEDNYVEREVFLRTISKEIEKPDFYTLTDNEWKSVINYADVSIADNLHKKYIAIPRPITDGMMWKEKFANYYTQYFSRLPLQKQVELAFSTTSELKLIIQNDLFDAKSILVKAKNGEIKFAIACLDAHKKSYNKEDLNDMEELYHYLSNLPDTGTIKEVESGLFSSKGMKFICECGAKNDKEQEFCSTCGKNIKGLTKSQVKSIEDLKLRITILSEMLDQK